MKYGQMPAYRLLSAFLVRGWTGAQAAQTQDMGAREYSAKFYGAAIAVLWATQEMTKPVDELKSAVERFLVEVRAAW